MAFTPQKDVNLKILENLNDRDLLNYCQAGRHNHAIRNLCNDEGFWRRRTLAKFDNIKMSPGMTWREYYMYRLSHEIVVLEYPGIKTEVAIDKSSPYMLGLLQQVKELAREMEVDNNMKLKLKDDDEILKLIAQEVALQFQPNIDLNELDLGELLSVSEGNENVFDLTLEDINRYRRKFGIELLQMPPGMPGAFNADFDGSPVFPRLPVLPQLPGLPQLPRMPGSPRMLAFPQPQLPGQYAPRQLPPASPPLSPVAPRRVPVGGLPEIPQMRFESPPGSPRSPPGLPRLPDPRR